jgi:hypothetical protein
MQPEYRRNVRLELEKVIDKDVISNVEGFRQHLEIGLPRYLMHRAEPDGFLYCALAILRDGVKKVSNDLEAKSFDALIKDMASVLLVNLHERIKADDERDKRARRKRRPAGGLIGVIRRATIKARNEAGNDSLLSRLVGIPQPTLTRFIAGKDLPLESADRLCDWLGLELVRRDDS